MATIASLFTAPEDILAAQEQQNLLRDAAINQQGAGFGVFQPLYQAGVRGINTASQALFPTQDPRLQRATMIQGVLTKYQDQDMTDPDVLNKMSREFAAMGATKEAFSLAQEARAARKEVSAEKRAQAALDIQQAQERRAAYQFNPQLAIEDAGKLAEDDPQRTTLLTVAARLMEKDNFDKAAKTAKIDSDMADAIYKRAAADKMRKEAATAGGGKISTAFVAETPDGKGIIPLTEINGKLYLPDGRLATNVRMAREPELAALMRMQGGGTTTSGASQDSAAANAAAALERKRARDTADRQRSAGSEEVTIGMDGQVETRLVRNAPATAKQIDSMSLAEVQEYNRTGKIPSRLIGQ